MTANKGPKLSFEEKEYRRLELDDLRDKEEKPILRKSCYELIFPVKHDDAKMEHYSQLLKHSKEMQESFTHGKRTKPEVTVYDLMVKAQREKNGPKMQELPRTSPVKKTKKKVKETYDAWMNESTMKPKKKKELEHERMVTLESIQASKDEVKMKEKKKQKQVQKVAKKVLDGAKPDLEKQVEEMLQKAQKERDRAAAQRAEEEKERKL